MPGRLTSIYLERRLFLWGAGVVALFAAGYYAPPLAGAALVALAALGVLLLLDVVLLLRPARGLGAERELPARFSNGDPNGVTIRLYNRYPFAVRATVLDELPPELQVRDARYHVALGAGAEGEVHYTVRPVRRGRYGFGAVNVYAATPLGLASRRYRFGDGASVPVYPAFLQMRAYALLAASNRLTEAGVKPIRRLGHTLEFDHLREYVVGDDPAAVNWNATARRGTLMVNQYRDERAQPIYCVIDTGRVMKMPFEGMTLLDYSINSALVLANIALLKGDRAGLVTFSDRVHAVVPAERRPGQIHQIQERLYNVETGFRESDYARLAVHLGRHVRGRGLILLFTNFEARSAMQRQLVALQALARQHVVVAVFFENTELDGLIAGRAETTEGIYVKAVAEKFAFEKREIVALLRRHGIQSILTPPQRLTVETINTYLALKARGVI